MPRGRHRAGLLAVLVAYASGCGKSENDWPVTPVPEYGYADFAKRLPDYLCERLMRCPLAKDDQLVPRVLFQTDARCAEILKEALRRPARNFDPTDAIANGRIVFDGDKAHAYLDALAGACDSSGARLDPTAGGALRGTVEAGGGCAVSVECTKGNYCAHDSGACPGACATLKANAASCSDDHECESGYCASGTCAKLTVAAPAAEGEPCGLETGPSATRTLCAANSWCQGSPTGVCRRPLPADAPCTSQDDLCVTGHLCLTDVDGQKRCRPITVANDGELCTDESSPDVRLCDAFAFLTCEQGKCSRLGTTEGSSCVRNDFLEACDAGLYCASQTQVCTRLGQADDPCTGTEDCASGYCVVGTHTCSDSYCD